MDVFLAIGLAELCPVFVWCWLFLKSWESSYRLRLQPGTGAKLCYDGFEISDF